MVKAVPFCLMILWIPVSISAAYSLEWQDPLITQNELAVYRTIEEGKELRMTKELRVLVHEHEYSISFSLLDETGRSEFVTVFSRGTPLRALKVQRDKMDLQGNSHIKEEIQLLDNPNYSKDICPLFGNYFAYRSLCGQRPGSPLAFPCLFSGGAFIPMCLKVRKGEKVTTPAGTFDCVEIEETFDVKSIAADIFGSFVKLFPFNISPKTFYWLADEHPHMLVKRKGMSRIPPHNTIVVDELVRYEFR